MSKEQTRVIIFCGLPGSGKTTLGKQLEQETAAVRLCPDDWMADLGVDFYDEAFRERLEIRLWELGKQLLSLGHDVILENGLWARSERDDKRRDAEELGVSTELHFFDVPYEELLRRLAIRNVSAVHGAAPISAELMAGYAQVFQAPDEQELALFNAVVIHRE